MSRIRTEDLTRIYGRGETALTALSRVNLSVEPGEFVAVIGPSGSGKSTLLHLIGGLDRPTEGRVLVDSQDLAALDDDGLATLRRRRIGLVFEWFSLSPVLTAVENAAVPMLLDGAKPGPAKLRAADWLRRLGLGHRLGSRPDQLSGGEKQRVAIARAMLAEPALILADEPTGNLDTRAGDEIAGLLRQAAAEWGSTVLVVTHDPRIASYADRLVFLKDGKVIDQARLASQDAEARAQRAGERPR